MTKKLTALFLTFLIVFSFSACGKKKKLQYGWQQTKTTTAAPEQTTPAPEETTAPRGKFTVDFSVEKATTLGMFEFDVYGLLTLFYQDGCFLMFDDFGNQKFEIPAEGYDPASLSSVALAIAEDLDFDGKNDFRVKYKTEGNNDYYLCFLWDPLQRTFRFTPELSALPSPEFDAAEFVIRAHDRSDTNAGKILFYSWDNGKVAQYDQTIE